MQVKSDGKSIKYRPIKLRALAYERAREIAFVTRRPMIDVVSDAVMAVAVPKRRKGLRTGEEL